MTISQVDSRLDSAALLVEELIDKLQTGDTDVEAFIAAHPEQSSTLRRLLPALRVMADLSNSAEDGHPSFGSGGAVAPHEHCPGLRGGPRARRSLLRDAVYRGAEPGDGD